MDTTDIEAGDWNRILFGEAPPEIILEAMVRSIILYLALLLVVRLLGKRTNSILTVTERAVFITLGAIVAMPMHGPSHGIAVGLIVLCVVLLSQRSLTRSFFFSQRWEDFMQGRTAILVKDGIIAIDQLEKHFISRQQLFELLREKEIRHLGQVKRAYMEASGTFSIFKNKDTWPGLSILPVKDIQSVVILDPKHNSCTWCGNTCEKKKFAKCSVCGHDHWVSASKEFIKDG